MHAWISDEPGHKNLTIIERDVPTPCEGEVLVRMAAASLNYRDTIVVDGKAPGIRPIVPLSCGAGTVEAIGEGVSRVAVGDRVAPLFFQDWMGGPGRAEYQLTSLGGGVDGCLAEYMCLREQGVSKVPAHLSDGQVATLPCAGLTAWNGLNCGGLVKAGDIVLVQGTGGVSIFALQFAKMAGAEVIVTSSSGEKLERAKDLGADYLINYVDTPKWGSEVMNLTAGRGVDIVVEVGGAGTMIESLEALRIGGHIAVIGILEGNECSVPMMHIIGKSACIQGIYVGSRDSFEDMCRALDATKSQPIISDTFGYEDAISAFDKMKSQTHFGKIVIDYAT